MEPPANLGRFTSWVAAIPWAFQLVDRQYSPQLPSEKIVNPWEVLRKVDHFISLANCLV